VRRREEEGREEVGGRKGRDVCRGKWREGG
jgi:hypothetical protein